MDGVTQSLTNAWLTSVAANPVLGSIGMLLAIVVLNYLRPLLPWLSGGGTPKPAPAEESRWQIRMADLGDNVSETAEAIADELKRHNDIQRRKAEALERIERLLVALLAKADGGRPAEPPPVRPSRPRA